MAHTCFPKGGPDPLEVGGTFEENVRLMGFPAEVNWTVEELHPARTPAIRARARWRWTWRPATP